MTPADPGWKTRAADGTAIIRYGDFATPQMQRFAGALTFQGTVDPNTLKILTVQSSTFGQDVTFQIADKSGQIHAGHATVLYPVRAHEPGFITELVYES